MTSFAIPRCRAGSMQQAPPSVWIKRRNNHSRSYDVMDNAFVQLHGRKRFRMWGPEVGSSESVPRSPSACAWVDVAQVWRRVGQQLFLNPMFSTCQRSRFTRSRPSTVCLCQCLFGVPLAAPWGLFSLCPFLYAVAVGLCLML